LVSKVLSPEERLMRIYVGETLEKQLEAHGYTDTARRLRIQRRLLAAVRKYGYGIVPAWAQAVAEGGYKLMRASAGAPFSVELNKLMIQKAGATRSELEPGTWQRELVDIIYEELGLR